MFEKRRGDALVDAYIRWRQACGAVRAAYAAWNLAPAANHEHAFHHYVAALDDEDDAAFEYAERLAEISDYAWVLGLKQSAGGPPGPQRTSAPRRM
jgi:hypothetical protein